MFAAHSLPSEIIINIIGMGQFSFLQFLGFCFFGRFWAFLGILGYFCYFYKVPISKHGGPYRFGEQGTN